LLAGGVIKIRETGRNIGIGHLGPGSQLAFQKTAQPPAKTLFGRHWQQCKQIKREDQKPRRPQNRMPQRHILLILSAGHTSLPVQNGQ